jgi:hypothetical protein
LSSLGLEPTTTQLLLGPSSVPLDLARNQEAASPAHGDLSKGPSPPDGNPTLSPRPTMAYEFANEMDEIDPHLRIVLGSSSKIVEPELRDALQTKAEFVIHQHLESSGLSQTDAAVTECVSLPFRPCLSLIEIVLHTLRSTLSHWLLTVPSLNSSCMLCARIPASCSSFNLTTYAKFKTFLGPFPSTPSLRL